MIAQAYSTFKTVMLQFCMDYRGLVLVSTSTCDCYGTSWLSLPKHEFFVNEVSPVSLLPG